RCGQRKAAIHNYPAGRSRMRGKLFGRNQCCINHGWHVFVSKSRILYPTGSKVIRGLPLMSDSRSLKGKTVFISGGSRGIGLAIALRAAQDGANIVIAAKTAKPNPKLPGTIYTAAEAIETAGGHALPLQVDIREETEVAAAVKKTEQEFGGIDILINNASAISLTGTLETPMKRYDLMMDVNVRGTLVCSHACVRQLNESDSPHMLTPSPPTNLTPRWFARHTAYTMSTHGMSLCTLGLAAEFRESGIGV